MTAIKQPTPFPAELDRREDPERERIFDLFRRWGYLQANLDPLGFYLHPLPVPELDEQRGALADEARRYYCGSIGADFMFIPEREQRRWIQQRLESDPPAPDRARILDLLLRAELFEQVIQSRYLGTKRFSLEGITALIPFLDRMMQDAIGRGAQQAVLAMSHRGRLNVMVHIVGTPPADIFARFEDVDPRSVLGGGDVKYHIGATGDYQASDGRKLHVHLVSNPSHLEAVDPVAMGRTRAKQIRRGDNGSDQVFAIVIHGDAAFAGQGIWAETLNYAEIPGYSVGGSIHVIANNLIGFTGEPVEEHSSRFASDLARRNNIPVLHVNGEDPDAVVRLAQIALEYRYTFHRDVIVDILGYRRHGHSEIDDPTITQPLVYRRIKDHPPLWQIYAERIGKNKDVSDRARQVQEELAQAQKQGAAATKQPRLATLPDYWSKYKGGSYKKEYEVETGLPAEQLNRLAQTIGSAPAGFNVHPKVKKLLDQRREMGAGKRPVDYGMAEALAFGSLLESGTPIRLSGQDSRRGTFNQRHDVLIDIENADEYIPLQHIYRDQARFEVHNSSLSEAGVMGFEYGYSRDFPETLTLWEAQFGDFANGAQVIIDQFIAAGEDKWNLLSGLVLLLPHGYEGQGPEHSSARIERYLQLAARDNMQICQPSNAAQYFHLLRRQALRPWRKPLVVFTPKSMLRHPDAVSPLADFSAPHFHNVLADREVENAARVLLCSGKIGHDLREERKRRKDTQTAVIFLEQMYPFPEAELQAELDRHSGARDILWVQEEPANMGALWYVMPRLRRLARGRPARSVKRSASASPATGSAKAHDLEQKTLLALAFA
jgi:2-oxoglutarate dehydrogenase E1 component